MSFFFLYHLVIFSLFNFSLTCTLQRGKSPAYLGQQYPRDAYTFGRLSLRRRDKTKRCAETGSQKFSSGSDAHCVKKAYLFAEPRLADHDGLTCERGAITSRGGAITSRGGDPQTGELCSEQMDIREKRFALVRSGVDRLLYINRNLFDALQVVGSVPVEGGSTVETKKKKKVQADGQCPEEVEMLLEGMRNFHFNEERVKIYTDLIGEIVDQGMIPLTIVESAGKVDSLDKEFRNYVAMLLLRGEGIVPVGTGPLAGSPCGGTTSGQAALQRQDEVRGVAKKLLLLKEAIMKLSQEHKVRMDAIYLDEETGDVKVKRNSFEDGSERRSNWKLIFLGTGSMYPSTNRGTSSFLLQTTKKKCNEAFLFDCGENTFIALQRASIKISKIKNIFLTHLHGDHCLGIISVLTMLRNSNTINIYGPEGTHRFLRNTFSSTYSKRMAKFFVYELKGGAAVHSAKMTPPPGKELITAGRKKRDDVEFILPNEHNMYTVLRNDYLEVLGFPIKHTVPTIGYVIRELNVESKFNAPYIDELIKKNYNELKKCEKLEYIPYKIYEHVIRKMNDGDVVVFPDKTQLTYGNAYKEVYRGRKIVVCQDTYDASSLEQFATDADVLIHEATNSLIDLTDQGVAAPDGLCEDHVGPPLPSGVHGGEALMRNDVPDRGATASVSDNAAKSSSKQVPPGLVKKYNKIIAERGHSTANMAGTFAKKINAKKLILTHFSQRYIGDNKLKNISVMRKIEREAEESFGGISQGESKDGPDCSSTTDTGCDGEREVIAAYDGLIVYVPPQRVK
ncbi:hypothetical protein AK88_02453 [Plasmodium fragile]|uniref:Uncharacterized protein n=1 Tax=Plasmodium fragile TaxID=5857 RepID=A0A0D9QLD8_PLAFR|nr:uncharacterized protein AK88_02453 [Plasmodium fragile]KJP87849.1 hypothetical protein AK88_02453 [Plasmodium fragile]